MPQWVNRILPRYGLLFLVSQFLVLGNLSTTYAQTILGVRGGANYGSLLARTEGQSYDSRIGMWIGTYCEYVTTARTSLQAELAYTTKAAVREASGEDLVLSYVALTPVMARTNVLRIRGFTTGLVYGMVASFRTNATYERAYKFDLGFMGGAEIARTFGGRQYPLQVRYERGFIPIDHGAVMMYNSVTSVLIGFDVFWARR